MNFLHWLEWTADFWVHNWQAVSEYAGAAAGAVFVALFLSNFYDSYRLLRLYHTGEVRGTRISALSQCVLTVLASPFTVVRARSLFKRTRMQLEYEALVERPRPKLLEPDDRKERYHAKLAHWRAGQRKLFAASSNETVEVETPQSLHDRFAEVDLYFKSLRKLGLTAEMQFETKIKIKNGFVAPLHLVAGMLRKFEEDWGRVLRVYERDRGDFSEIVGEDTRRALTQLRDIQLFIFDCWLLWGPSIPICSPNCRQFAGNWSSLQYGFGDENNSVELVGASEFLTAQWDKLAPPPGVRAVSASVRGHIANSRFLSPDETVERMGPATAKSWDADADGKLLVRLSEEEAARTADQEGHHARAIRTTGTGMIELGRGESYYSAYLWAIFVVLREEPGAATSSERAWIPVHRDPAAPRRSLKPWLDFFSFFEHGNIADPETYAFLKNQLAEKAISGLAKLVAAHQASAARRDYPLRFAFACSIDHSGCGHGARFEPETREASESGFASGSLPDLMWLQVRDRWPELKDIVLFTYYGADVHPHSACNLPQQIDAYFAHMEA